MMTIINLLLYGNVDVITVLGDTIMILLLFIALKIPAILKKITEIRTGKIVSLTYDGVVHIKDRKINVNCVNNQMYSDTKYITRIKTTDGFFDSYRENDFLTYKEYDKVKILVENRYNKKGKLFKQDTIIIGLSCD